MASNCLWQILLWAEAVNDDHHNNNNNNVCVLFLSIPVSGIKHHQAAAALDPAYGGGEIKSKKVLIFIFIELQ